VRCGPQLAGSQNIRPLSRPPAQIQQRINKCTNKALTDRRQVPYLEALNNVKKKIIFGKNKRTFVSIPEPEARDTPTSARKGAEFPVECGTFRE